MATSTTQKTLEVVTRFENNFNKHDADLLMKDMTQDTVFEHIAPAGKSMGRFEGHDAVRAAFASLPEQFPGCKLELIGIFANGDRCATQWEVRWDLPDGTQGVIVGADFFKMQGDKIKEKLSYMTS